MHAIGALKAWNAVHSAPRPRKNLNHMLHALATLATFGLWLPVWTFLCIRNEGWKSRHDWTLAGKTSVGLRRFDRLDVSPETLSRLRRG